MQIGFVGFGRLGKLIAKYMSVDADLFIYDKKNYEQDIVDIGATPSQLDKVCSCPIVILFVPISHFEDVIVDIKDKLTPQTLVIDVCSVKEYPVSIMKKHFKKDISILATHPMFGPDSAKETLMGTKIVLCPVKIDDKLFNNIRHYLERHGIKVIISTPKEHDQQISQSLLLTHYIGRALIELGAQKLNIDTVGYRRLMKILNTVQNDSWQLFKDMNYYNKYSKETRDRFLLGLQKIQERIIK